ncbi:DUF4320 family protein [Anoxybacillus rupiensis]|uniref:DUF4320 family protein n=1 Tax=Anoxybacteroides rupiense TaxID=311460 RepID=A0ABD5IY48_9BACL|nr:DUF4320 family protein [Anoxybacillus rupiensis]
MSNTISYFLTMIFSLFFVVVILESILFAGEVVKVHTFVQHAAELGAKYGGYKYNYNGQNINILDDLEEEMINQNLGDFQVDYTRDKVNYNEDVFFAVRGQYTFYTFRLIGFDLIKLPIYAKKIQSSQVWFR